MADPATATCLVTACFHLLMNTCNAGLKPVNVELAETVSSCINHDTNLSSLSNSLRQLEALAEKLKANVEEEEAKEAQMRICNPEIREWQKKVSEVVIRARPLVNYNSKDGGSQPGTCTCCNLTPCRRFRISRDVTRALQDVNDLLDQGGLFKPPFTLPSPPEAVLLMRIERQTFGIEAVMKQMWLQFNDNRKTVIGLYGLGGVGKTTLLKCFSNELRKQNNEYEFQAVIMLEVANTQTLNVVGMQKTIYDQLGVPWNEESSDGDRATFLLGALTKKKFVVLLDDVWNKFELKHVGIPTPLPEDNGSKLIVASREDSVCANMGATCPIEVHCLPEDEAWKLFLSRLTENVKDSVDTDEDMKHWAEEIVNSCGGLPLAIDVIGSTFAVSGQSKEWEEAATAMRQNPSSIEGVDYIFTVLKWSYDKLEDTEKKCFLYCTMFPDYGSIRHEQLIEYWVAEGFISPQPYEGYRIIKKLLSASLLQRSNTDPTSEVKMHQMIRKMGHQQTSTENKLLIKVGQALKKAPDPQEWEEATRISLMCNDIKELSVSVSCSNLLSLLLQDNPNLSQLGSKFFHSMPVLKVLDLSHTAIKVLPNCGTLDQLVYLNLSHMPIREIPKQLCSGLVRLQYLNMSYTLITRLPKQLAKLESLTHLNLSETSALTVIPHGTISRLCMLKVLNLYKSNYGVKELPDLNLEELEQLTYLGITIYSQQVFHKLTTSDPLARCTRGLSLSRCLGMKSIQLSEFKTIMHLTKLQIESCNQLQELIIDKVDREDSANKVKMLTLANLPNLAKVPCWSEIHRFQDLRDLTIHECPKLQHVSWVLQFKSLEKLVITECHGLQRVVLEEIESVHERNSSEAASAAGGGNLLPKLRIMELKQLSSLESIGWRRGFICLESITVDQCWSLRQLSERNMYPKLKQICAEPSWWKTIAPEVKTNFEDIFIPIHNGS